MKSRLMKLRLVGRKVRDYIRYDLREIVYPSPLPNPPGYKPPRKLTKEEWWEVIKKGFRVYCASFVRDVGPDIRPEYYRKLAESQAGRQEESKKEEESTWEDLAVAARGGMETLKPALQRLYMMRVSSYKDALKSFIEGYQDGIQETLRKNEEGAKAKEDGSGSQKST